MTLPPIHFSHSEAWGHLCLYFFPSSHILSFLDPKYFLNICTLFLLLHHSLLKTEFLLPVAWTTAVALVVILPHLFLPSFKWATGSFSVWLWITTQSLSLYCSSSLFTLATLTLFLFLLPSCFHSSCHSSSPMPFPLPERLFPPWYTPLGFTHPSGHCLSHVTSRNPPVTSLTSLNLPSLGSCGNIKHLSQMKLYLFVTVSITVYFPH